MRAVIQRVKKASVTVDEKEISKINAGLCVLLGIGKEDNLEDITYIKEKIINLRIFEDENEKMNKSLIDVSGELMVVSQFTLYGDARKGRRPNFMEALGGEAAEKLYEDFISQCKEAGFSVATGIFGADMQVSLVNDGPVTILLDSKKNF